MQEEEHGTLVVEDVHVQVLAAEHGVADGHIDMGIVPRIERVEEGAGAVQRGDERCKYEQEYGFLIRPRLHKLQFYAQRYIIFLTHILLLSKKVTVKEVFVSCLAFLAKLNYLCEQICKFT